MHGRDTTQTKERRWWSRPLASALSAAKTAASACATLLVKRKKDMDIMSHPIQCKTWCTEHTRTYRYHTPLRAVVIKGKRYAGSNTCSMHKHMKYAHSGVYTRFLDDGLTGYKRHVYHCRHTGAKPSGIYRAMLHSNAHAHYALLDRYPVLVPRSGNPENEPSTIAASYVLTSAAQQCTGGGSSRKRGPTAGGTTAPQPPVQGTLLQLSYPRGHEVSARGHGWMCCIVLPSTHAPSSTTTRPSNSQSTTPCVKHALLPCSIHT